MKKFAYLESGEGDPTEFLKWQNELRMNDLMKEQERIEMKKLQSKLSYEEAILAKANQVELNKLKVKKIQEENNRINYELAEKNRIESEKRMNQVKNIIEDEKKVKAIKEQVVNEKKTL